MSIRSSSGPERRAWYSIAQRGPRRQPPTPAPPPQRQEHVAFFRTGKWQISYAFPGPDPLPEPKTVGDHLLRCRLQHGWTQVRAARELSICPETYRAWERGRVPPDRFWPIVIRSLGYDPTPLGTTLAERMRRERRSIGYSIKSAAIAIGCDESTFARWEAGTSMPTPEAHRRWLAILSHRALADNLGT